MEKKTKTLLVTNIPDISIFTKKLKESFEIREVYTIPNNDTFLFVIFYNIKDADQCQKELLSKGYKAYFTISKYEFPKDHEKCDKDKNQSTLFISSKNLSDYNESVLSEYGEIREIRGANPTTICVEYFDSRSADTCVSELSKKGVTVKYVWDMSTKTKWDIIRHTDSVISQVIPPVQKKKKPVINVYKNMFIKEFDEFISENIDDIIQELNSN
ncbi:MEI2-like protein [Vairimorpha necatrix]|uniref:MEI2-like protein n=1 Tax=Vairimorpha necatrix TaxID=6039 RepID=A0AAX4JBD4_9MICR